MKNKVFQAPSLEIKIKKENKKRIIMHYNILIYRQLCSAVIQSIGKEYYCKELIQN